MSHRVLLTVLRVSWLVLVLSGLTGCGREQVHLKGPAGPVEATHPGGPGAMRFSFDATAGHTYRFTCRKGTLESFLLLARNEAGQEVARASLEPSDSEVSVEPRSALGGRVFIEVSTTGDGGSFSWRLEDVGPDDHGNTAPLATMLEAASQRFTGTLGHAGDVDFLGVEGQAGFTYRLSCQRAVVLPSGSWSVAAWDSRGARVSFAEHNLHSNSIAVDQRAATQEPLFFSVSSKVEAPLGSYSCSLDVLGRDDHGNDTRKATPIEPSAAPLPGAFEVPRDIDVFSVPLVAGHYYRSTCEAVTALSCDVSIQDPSGSRLFSHDSSQEGLFKALVTGTHFIELRSKQESRGSYRYQLQDAGPDDHGDTRETATALASSFAQTTGRIENASDVDVFSFEATQVGHVYRMRCGMAPNLMSWSILFRDEAGTQLAADPALYGEPAVAAVEVTSLGRYFIEVSWGKVLLPIVPYTCTLEDIGPEDHGDTVATATPFSTTVQARHETREDVDYFSFTAKAGHVYSVRCEGLTGCGVALLSAKGDAVNFALSPPWALKVPSDGTYVLAVGFNWYSTFLGSYSLTLEDIGPDDHGDTVATATPLSGGDSVMGWFHTGDRDTFSIQAPAGATYRLSCEGCYLNQLSSSDDAYLYNPFVSPYPPVIPFLLQAKRAGTVTVYASSVNGPSYTLTLEEVPDDHGDDAAHATPLTLGTKMDGTFETHLDSDCYSVTLTAGQQYRLSAPSALLLRAPDGTDIWYATFTAELSGTYSLCGGTGREDRTGPYWVLLEAAP